jgi:hypothetical protein
MTACDVVILGAGRTASRQAHTYETFKVLTFEYSANRWNFGKRTCLKVCSCLRRGPRRISQIQEQRSRWKSLAMSSGYEYLRRFRSIGLSTKRFGFAAKPSRRSIAVEFTCGVDVSRIHSRCSAYITSSSALFRFRSAVNLLLDERSQSSNYSSSYDCFQAK